MHEHEAIPVQSHLDGGVGRPAYLPPRSMMGHLPDLPPPDSALGRIYSLLEQIATCQADLMAAMGAIDLEYPDLRVEAEFSLASGMINRAATAVGQIGHKLQH